MSEVLQIIRPDMTAWRYGLSNRTHSRKKIEKGTWRAIGNQFANGWSQMAFGTHVTYSLHAPSPTEKLDYNDAPRCSRHSLDLSARQLGPSGVP